MMKTTIKKRLGILVLLVVTALASFNLGRNSHITSVSVPGGDTVNIKNVKHIGETPNGDTIVLTYDGSLYMLSKTKK